MRRLIFLAAALLSPSVLHAATDELQLRWIAPPDPRLEINGLPWYSENNGELFRLPAKLMDTFRPEVWNLAKSPSGARIRFRSDSPVIAIRVEYPSPPDMRNMHAFGQTGVDLYADGVYCGTITADKDAKTGKVYEHVFFDVRETTRAVRDIVLYLPLYKPAKVVSIGIEKEA